PQSVQVKLLRVLQEREFKRVGGVKDIKVDVRIIAATNQCLEDLIKDGEFREDLFYRLNILPIHIPPLRERKEDIPLLVSRFIDKYSNEVKRKNISISNEAMSLLESYHWKGNVRELENIIERAVVLTTGSLIEPENFPDEVRFFSEQAGQEPVDLPDEGVDLEEVVSCVEKDLLTKALSKTGGKKKEAARLVNLSFRSFRYKLAKYGIGAAGKRNSDE
ncbi:Response regulator of zinc sigma-54-dependent two-component system, partial [hydrothermal vent metagenome]